MNAFQSRNFGFIDCDNDLATSFEPYSMLGAELLDGRFAPRHVVAFNEPGFVINTRMQNS